MKRCVVGGFWLVMVFVLFAGCEPPAPPSRSKIRPPSGDLPPGFHNLTLDQALSLAKTENKLVMVDFYADWCGPCRMLDANTWPDGQVQTWIKDKVVAIKINIDKDAGTATKFEISTIPQLVFLKPDGTEIGRLRRYYPPKEFLSEADNILAGKSAE